MKRILIAIVMISMLTGCTSQIETDEPEVSLSPEEEFLLEFERWVETAEPGDVFVPTPRPDHQFSGSFEGYDGQLSPVTTDWDGETLVMDKTAYRQFSEDLCYLNSQFFHWNFNLSCFEPIGEIGDGSLVWTMKDDPDRQILLIADPKNIEEGIACFIREDSSILDVHNYSFSDFDAFTDKEMPDQGVIQRIWEVHNGTKPTPETIPPNLDGYDQTWSLDLKCKNSPALSYVIIVSEDESHDNLYFFTNDRQHCKLSILASSEG